MVDRKMKRFLLTPVGFYMRRTLHGIADAKPDKIILITSQDPNWAEFQKDLIADLKKRLEMWIQTKSLLVIEWESLSNYEKCLRDFLKTIDKIKRENPDAEVFVDITSATRFFNIAAVNASMLYKKVSLVYTPRSASKSFADLNPKDKHDWGKDSLTIQLPYIPALERFEKNPQLKSIILTLLWMGGEFSTMRNLLQNIKNDHRREMRARDLIRLSRHVAVLEEYGFVQSYRVGRRRVIKLTDIGQVLAKVFLEREEAERDLTFDHVEAWLFYPHEISYGRKERDPKRNNPRMKLVCNTITKKAFFVDDDVWRMIYEGQIRWHSEDEQDLERWCRKMGYQLFKRDARLADMLEKNH